MADTRYSEEHEWIRVEGDIGTIGITQYAQEQLGDVVFVDLPAGGPQGGQGRGQRGGRNRSRPHRTSTPRCRARWSRPMPRWPTTPGDVNAEPMGKGWFFKLKLADKSELPA